MPEAKEGNDMRRLAVRVSPDYHAQLSMVAQVDEMSLTDVTNKYTTRACVPLRKERINAPSGITCLR